MPKGNVALGYIKRRVDIVANAVDPPFGNLTSCSFGRKAPGIGFPINIFWPVDKDTTRLEWIYYALPPEGEDRFPDELSDVWKARRKVYNQIMAEDEMNMAPMQRSMESPALTGIPINYQERRIWHLHEEIDRVIGVDNIPEHLRMEQLLNPWVER